MTLLSSSTLKDLIVSFSDSKYFNLRRPERVKIDFKFPDVSIGSRLLAGCTTGGMAVALAQPTDVVKVRFQAQARSNEYARRYCGTIDAYKTIAKEEGIRGLWKGYLRLRDGVSITAV